MPASVLGSERQAPGAKKKKSQKPTLSHNSYVLSLYSGLFENACLPVVGDASARRAKRLMKAAMTAAGPHSEKSVPCHIDCIKAHKEDFSE